MKVNQQQASSQYSGEGDSRSQRVRNDTHQFLLAKTILQKGVSERPRSPKYDRSCEEDFEAVHEEAVDRKLEAQKHIVDERYCYRRCDSVYRVQQKF